MHDQLRVARRSTAPPRRTRPCPAPRSTRGRVTRHREVAGREALRVLGERRPGSGRSAGGSRDRAPRRDGGRSTACRSTQAAKLVGRVEHERHLGASSRSRACTGRGRRRRTSCPRRARAPAPRREAERVVEAPGDRAACPSQRPGRARGGRCEARRRRASIGDARRGARCRRAAPRPAGEHGRRLRATSESSALPDLDPHTGARSYRGNALSAPNSATGANGRRTRRRLRSGNAPRPRHQRISPHRRDVDGRDQPRSSSERQDLRAAGAPTG